MKKDKNIEEVLKEFDRRIKKTGWYPHIKMLGYRSKEEFLGFIQSFIQDKLEAQQAKHREEVMKIIKPKLDYCQKQNGKSYCKNCGLDKEEFTKLLI